MDTFETAFRLTIRGFGRSFGGHEELMGRSDLDVWKSADKLISSRSYNKRNEQVLLNIDMRAAIQHIDFWHDLETSRKKIIDFINDKLAIPKEIDPVRIDSIIIMPAILKDDKHNDIRYDYLIHFIHDIYLLMNLASPGSCNLLYATISTIDESWSKTLNLGGSIFEDPWHKSLKNKWPKVTSFPFDRVFEWFSTLDIGTRSLAESSIHKALFALLHVDHDLTIEPASLVWLAHAIESLYDAPPVLSFSFLKQRIAEFLHLPPKKEKWLNKILRQFYDDRNAFVHGGMPIAHPILIGSDESEDKYYEKLIDARNIGSLLVIATLQEYISRGWKNIVYKEKILGITV